MRSPSMPVSPLIATVCVPVNVIMVTP
jgi:hypothetical protein